MLFGGGGSDDDVSGLVVVDNIVTVWCVCSIIFYFSKQNFSFKYHFVSSTGWCKCITNKKEL